jgi:hypothetical protein
MMFDGDAIDADADSAPTMENFYGDAALRGKLESTR